MSVGRQLHSLLCLLYTLRQYIYLPLCQTHNRVTLSQGESQHSVAIVVVVHYQLAPSKYTGQYHNRQCRNGRWGLCKQKITYMII